MRHIRRGDDPEKTGVSNMMIKSAEFVTSAVAPSHYPLEPLPEIAFAGRSNVGKSSLINVLVNRKRLVKTSRTPGRTQTINFFRIDGAFHFVDLPGYGYARVPESIRRQWGPMVEIYLKKRSNLKGVVVLVDIRRRPGPEELELKRWLADSGHAAVWVLTKSDKLSRSQALRHQHDAALDLGLQDADLIRFSCLSREGKHALWAAVSRLLGTDSPQEPSLQGGGA